MLWAPLFFGFEYRYLAWVTTQVSNWAFQRSGNPKSKHVRVNLAWVTTQVSNWVWFGLSDYSGLESRVIWLGWPPKSQIGDNSAWVTTQVSNRGWFGLGDHPSLKSGMILTFCQNRNLVVRPILEIHPSGQGEIVCLFVCIILNSVYFLYLLKMRYTYFLWLLNCFVVLFADVRSG